MNKHAVLFDLDGTLLNSLDDIAESANAMLVSFGFPPHPIDAYRYFVGNGAAVLIQRTLPADKSGDAELVNACLQEFENRYRRGWSIYSHLYEGVPEMLRALAQRSVPVAILSNKPQEFVDQCVAYYLAEFSFQQVLGLDGVRPRKPDPTSALEIARTMRIDPGRWLFLGDTSIDMETACRASMFPVGASWGFREIQELREAGAEVMIDHPTDLINVLES